ncbi:Myb/SANT-like DNA-binding domain protein [Medicago truncatula]|uniref:Myb/SANT-like DNA-binding domain protein n=1 Tax=Medicago truncatula TaxID=3880 RepID=A0A072U8P4_MEDTR|nr:Myb/SANT-like DNA-binding domain protein [Medicago truncatula]
MSIEQQSGSGYICETEKRTECKLGFDEVSERLVVFIGFLLGFSPPRSDSTTLKSEKLNFQWLYNNTTSASKYCAQENNKKEKFCSKDNNNNKKVYADWSDLKVNEIFIQTCLDQVVKNERVGTSFTKKGWKNIVCQFHESTGRDYDKIQLKNMYDALKKEWSMV